VFQGDFTKDELAARRARVAGDLSSGSIAVLQGAPKESGHELFRQTNDFYYLCGVEVPHSYLTIDASGVSTLYLPLQSEDQREKEGALLSSDRSEEAIQLTGVDRVLGLEDLEAQLEMHKALYVPMRPAEGFWMSWDTLRRANKDAQTDPWDGRLDRSGAFVESLRDCFPDVDLKDLNPILDDLRLVKTGTECELVRRAGKLTAVGILEAMKSTTPGVMEYQLDAVMRYVYLAGGSRDVGYRAIIAGGDNAWYGHYNANDQPLKDGDLVLVDCAPDYRYYTSDIGRMWPVNGTYSPVQRELYGFIVHYHQVLLDVIRPGVLAADICREAADRMRPVVEETTFSKEIYKASALRSLDKMHLTHPVGMAVHDVGHYKDDPLRAGLVITLDPMMWIPEERLYIRVEDTLLMTEDGYENLTQDAPLDLDDVEQTMKDDGMLVSFPPQ